ncbi:hypothetical protein M5689_011371 [Euphorbia peplus]|nr:hypothetical protein M5689_011371 [Euphorbia peplus]
MVSESYVPPQDVLWVVPFSDVPQDVALPTQPTIHQVYTRRVQPAVEASSLDPETNIASYVSTPHPASSFNLDLPIAL